MKENRESKTIPHNFLADLVILKVVGSNSTLTKTTFTATHRPQKLSVIAYDQGRNQIRVYRHSKFAIHPDKNSSSQARIHANAEAMPGNSGGAVVDQRGILVGILASGDGKFSEIIPIKHLNSVIKNSDPKHEKGFFEVGSAIRKCADLLFESRNIPKKPPSEMVQKLKSTCFKSKNKMLFDQAGRTFGKWWMHKISETFA